MMRSALLTTDANLLRSVTVALSNHTIIDTLDNSTIVIIKILELTPNDLSFLRNYKRCLAFIEIAWHWVFQVKVLCKYMFR